MGKELLTEKEKKFIEKTRMPIIFWNLSIKAYIILGVVSLMCYFALLVNYLFKSPCDKVGVILSSVGLCCFSILLYQRISNIKWLKIVEKLMKE